MSVRRSADDVIKIIVPYFNKNMEEIPVQLRDKTIQSIKKGFLDLNSNVHSFEGSGFWVSRKYVKVTIIESQGKNPFSELGTLPLNEEMQEEVIILEESRGIRESDVNPPNIIEYDDGSKVVIYEYLYFDSFHPEGDPVLLVEHYSSEDILGRYYYPRNYLNDDLLKEEFMPI